MASSSSSSSLTSNLVSSSFYPSSFSKPPIIAPSFHSLKPSSLSLTPQNWSTEHTATQQQQSRPKL
ncbi:hypothetical protein OIU78_030453 [Salix suchowensis]|nr:hypothetical protein OIU78_030453 [Salix suchowensis]